MKGIMCKDQEQPRKLKGGPWPTTNKVTGTSVSQLCKKLNSIDLKNELGSNLFFPELPDKNPAW